MAAEGQNDIILNVSGNTRQLEREIQKVANNSLVLNTKGFSQPLGKITGQLGEFEKSLAASNARVIAFGASAGAIYALQRALAETVKSVISVEKSLIEINSILNVSEKNLTKFGNNLFEIAKNTGQSFNEVAKSALEFSRQGLTVEQTLKRTSDALILARLSGMDVVDSTNAITAALNSFNQTTISSTELVNKLVAVDAGFAVSSADLAEAIKRVGSSAQDVGVSLDELIAIVTSAQQTTARGGAVIGNSFKTIFTRVQRPKVLEALEQIGVKTRDLEGNMLPLMQILGDLSIKFDTLGGSQRAQIAELVGGVYQINILKAALGDLSKEFSIYNQALGISSKATNEAMNRNEEYNTSISAMLNKTINNLTKASSEIGNITLAPMLKKSLDLLNSGLESMSSDGAEYEGVGSTIGEGIAKGLGNFLSGPGLLFASAALIKVFERLTKYSYDAFKSLSGINAKSAEQQQLQAQILNLISRNPAIIEQINKGTLNTTSLHRDLLTYIQAETIAMEKQLAVANTLSKTLLQSGVRVPQSGDLKGLPVKQMKYFGFIPNFNYEEAETFGAAMGGYKAGKVKTMNIPKEGKVIYNDAESVVKMPGFSQPAIMPPEKSKAGENYKKTFEDKYGFNPYKYFGFIPNFNRERWMGPKGAVSPRSLQKGFTASAEELVYEKGWIRLSGKLAEEASLRRGQKVLSENNTQIGKLKNDEGDDVVFVKSATSDKVGDAQKVTNLLQGSLGRAQQDTATSRLRGDKLSENVKDFSSKYVLVYPGFGSVSKSVSSGIDKNTQQKYSFSTYPFPGSSTELNIGEDVYKSARENIVNLSKSFVSKLKTDPKLISGEKFERGVQSNLGIDTISSFVGSAFEAGLKASIESVPQTRIDNFDLSKKELLRLDETYKQLDLQKYAEGDLKNSLSEGNLNSMAEKIGKKAGMPEAKNLEKSNQLKAKNTDFPLAAASGFIPNFSAIKDAINREEEASGERARVLWSDTLGTPVVVNNKQTAEYGANADRIIYNDHIKQGQYASYNNLMKTGSGKEKYKNLGFIPNFAPITEGRYAGLSNDDVKEALDARKAGFGDLKNPIEKLKRALSDAEQTIIKANSSTRGVDTALRKVVVKYNLSESETEKLKSSLSGTSSSLRVAQGRIGKLFSDDKTSEGLKKFKDKALFASFGLSMLGGFAQSLAGDNKQLSELFGGLSTSISTATTVMGLIPGPAGVAIGGLIGVGGALDALWKSLNDNTADLESELGKIKDNVSKFNSSTQEYSNALQKFNDAIKNKAKAEELDKLNEALLDAISEIPAAYRAQLLAITDNTELQEKITQIQQQQLRDQNNTELVLDSQKKLNEERGIIGSIGEGISAGYGYLEERTGTRDSGDGVLDNRFDRENLIYKTSADLDKGTKTILGGMSQENQKKFLQDIGTESGSIRFSRMGKEDFSNELTKNYGLNTQTGDLLDSLNDQEIENLQSKLSQLGVEFNSSAEILEKTKAARQAYQKTIEEEDEKIRQAEQSLNKFKISLETLSKTAIKGGTFKQKYQDQEDTNFRTLELQKLSGLFEYQKPYLTETAATKLNFDVDKVKREDEFINASKLIQDNTKDSILGLGEKLIENSKNQEGDSPYKDEDSQNSFRSSLAEIANQKTSPEETAAAVKQAYLEAFKQASPGDQKEFDQNVDSILTDQNQQLVQLNQKNELANKIAEEQLQATLKQQEQQRQVKAFGGIKGFLNQDGYSKGMEEKKIAAQRLGYLRGYNDMPEQDLKEIQEKSIEEFNSQKQSLEDQGKRYSPRKLMDDIYSKNVNEYNARLNDNGAGLGRYSLQAALDAKELSGGIAPGEGQLYEDARRAAIEGRTKDIMRRSKDMASTLYDANMPNLAQIYEKRSREDEAKKIATVQVDEELQSKELPADVKDIREAVNKIAESQKDKSQEYGLSNAFKSAMQEVTRDFTSELRDLVQEVKSSEKSYNNQKDLSGLVKEKASIDFQSVTAEVRTNQTSKQLAQAETDLGVRGISNKAQEFIINKVRESASDPTKNVPTYKELVASAKESKDSELTSELKNMGLNTSDEKYTSLQRYLDTARTYEAMPDLNNNLQQKRLDLASKINDKQNEISPIQPREIGLTSPQTAGQNEMGANFDKLSIALGGLTSLLGQTNSQTAPQPSDSKLTVDFNGNPKLEGGLDVKITSDPVEIIFDEKSLLDTFAKIETKISENYEASMRQLEEKIKKISESNQEVRDKLKLAPLAPKN